MGIAARSINACQSGSIATALVALLIASSASGQTDREYLRRFLEEQQRKMPAVVVPPPSTAEFSTRRAPAATAIDMATARSLVGLTQPAMAARLPGGKLAIVDSGFNGLKAWLDAHPKEKALTSLVVPGSSPLKLEVDQTFGATGDSEHGYWVYRVARSVLPDVQILVYPIRGMDAAATALLDASTRGVVVSNVSLGWDSIFENYNEKEDALSRYLRSYLPQHEAFVFIAAGNEREATHSWISADRNANGYVDFRADGAAAPIDAIRIPFNTRRNTVSLTWNPQAHPDADYELQVTGPAGAPVYYSARARPGDVKGLINMYPAFSQATDGEIRVKRIAGPADGVFLRLRVDPARNPAAFNGLQTTNAYLHRENPFVTYVGSFGRTASGALAPSAFSNVGTTSDGRLLPHVLGPGQLLIDGRPTNGTSFSSPFITALYATQVGYNFKNLIARSSNFARFAAGVAPHERSRWGIPDPTLLAKLGDLVGPTKVENVSHTVENDHLVLKFAVTRCCMESLTWSIVASLADGQSGQPLQGPDGKPISAAAAMRSDRADFQRHPAEIRIPMATLAAAKGKKVRVTFDMKVRRWSDPPPGAIKIDQAPAYDFTI